MWRELDDTAGNLEELERGTWRDLTNLTRTDWV